MPHNHPWQSRIKAVEREYEAMWQAASRFSRSALDDPSILRGNLRQGEIVLALENLEGTYIILMFAEFETGARQYWDGKWATDAKTAGLLDGLAARCGIPDTQRDNAHRVRDYGNALVHERSDQPDMVSIGYARRFLCHFFTYLPPHW
jgi:hypothetical protein